MHAAVRRGAHGSGVERVPQSAARSDNENRFRPRKSAPTSQFGWRAKPEHNAGTPAWIQSTLSQAKRRRKLSRCECQDARRIGQLSASRANDDRVHGGVVQETPKGRVGRERGHGGGEQHHHGATRHRRVAIRRIAMRGVREGGGTPRRRRRADHPHRPVTSCRHGR